MEAALITGDLVKTLTGVETNINVPQRLQPHLVPVQRQHIRPVLGSALYESLCDAVEAAAAEDPTPLTAEQTELLDTLRPALAFHMIAACWPALNVHITQAGIVQKGGQQATTADYKAQSDARAVYAAHGDRFLTDLRTFLIAHAADYPEYVVPACTSPRTSGGGGAPFLDY